MKTPSEALGQRVEIYFNLRLKCFSVRCQGKVIGHTPSVILNNASFKVSEAGRQRVLATGQKNIHAVVRGELMALDTDCNPTGEQVTYNPFRYSSFVYKRDEKPIHSAASVLCIGRAIYLMDS